MFGLQGKGYGDVPKGKGKYSKGKDEEPFRGKRPAPTLDDEEEPKGGGKRAKGTHMVFTQSMKNALDLDKAFFLDVDRNLSRRTRGFRTIEELADEHGKVDEKYSFWASTLTRPLTP